MSPTCDIRILSGPGGWRVDPQGMRMWREELEWWS